ncbi:MAG: hypothetical protein ACYTKC_22430 [Planctomycetota bacterium]|jgi:hypothetical protein
MKATHTTLGLLLVATTVAAQAPFGYIVTAETYAGAGDGLVFVDPSTKIADRVTWLDGKSWNGGYGTVALDPTDPFHLYTIGGGSIAGPPIQQYVMEANRIVKFGAYGGPSTYFGMPGRMHVFPPGKVVLYTFRTNAPGLLSRTLTGTKKDTILARITDAFDVTSIGNMVYVSTYDRLGKNPSKVFAVDILNGRPPVQINITGLPASPFFQAMEADPNKGTLLLGDDNGDVWTVDPKLAKATKMAVGKGKGPVVAIAYADPKTVAYVANKNAVYDLVTWPLAVPPIYSTQETIMDMTVSPHDRGALVFFGKGCRGSNGKTPRMVFGGYPNMGVRTIRIQMVDGPANAKVLLFFGVSRKQWGVRPLPLSLGFMGAPSCNVYVSLDVGLGFSLTSAGVFNYFTGIPPNPSLKGVHVMAQYGINDPGANAANTTTTDAVELVIR